MTTEFNSKANYKTCLDAQRITLKDAIKQPDHSYYHNQFAKLRRESYYKSFAILLAGAALGVVSILGIKGCHREPQPAAIKGACVECHNRTAAFTAYFKKNGSRSPQEMAEAVLASQRNTRLLAAIAKVESGGNPDVRKTGFRKRHSGAYQVASRYHGTVPADAFGQTRQAEKLLEELVETHKEITVALNYYGGDTKGRYANTILAELQERTP